MQKAFTANGIIIPIARETARDRIWRSIRALRRFSDGDLIATASARRANVAEFLRALVDAGFVRVENAGQRGTHGKRVYSLALDAVKAPRLAIERIGFERRWRR